MYLETEPATYFFTDEQALSDACWNWLSEAFEHVDEDLIVLVADVDEEMVHVDLRIGFEAVVFEAVPPSAITRAYDLDTGEPVVPVGGPTQ
ncbi:hypothetical protein [Mycolicibacter longobardus]|uniref:Uncharacterized protein n=1 Tax=Mycolicibacter longobardus TaxID=1108812 RepID=A0A1X1YAH1_9MYCO|nr:hypothetical protein [Mycolicibacter longobardus]ORW08088.1 hypothetical protein AWC16_20355 [Mycolicibacter longobardus]